MSHQSDVAVVGAGPYGLAAAAHLRAAGADVAVFGRPMSFWSENMPKGMLLRSPWAASTIGDPANAYTLDRYEDAVGTVPKPLPLERFVAYGEWFRRSAGIATDEREIRLIERTPDGFRLRLGDDTETTARRVVVAAGIGPFAHRPQPFASLPSELVSHAVDHDDLGKFRGKRVLVVGRGQSALESAALLHENDAQVQVVFQNGAVHWLTRSARLHRMGAITKLLYAPTDIGPAGVSRLVAAPGWFRSFPRSAQQKMGVMSIRPAGAAWLIPRLRDVPLLTDAAAVEAKATAEGVAVGTADGRWFEADHVLLGTGYRVDVARYGFLGPEVLAGLRRTNGYPHLDRGFESSVAGLHFVGAPAAWSFGPLMRFVAGTKFAADRTSRRIAGRSAARVSRALNVAPSTEG